MSKKLDYLTLTVTSVGASLFFWGLFLARSQQPPLIWSGMKPEVVNILRLFLYDTIINSVAAFLVAISLFQCLRQFKPKSPILRLALWFVFVVWILATAYYAFNSTITFYVLTNNPLDSDAQMEAAFVLRPLLTAVTVLFGFFLVVFLYRQVVIKERLYGISILVSLALFALMGVVALGALFPHFASLGPF